MTAAEQLLLRLESVRQRGAGQWTARCPAHDDRNPSLSITEKDYRILICCHAGCGAADIMAAVGLTLSDLYDAPLDTRLPARHAPKPRINYRRVFELARHEAFVIAMAAGDLARNQPLSKEDMRIVLRALDNLNRIGEGHYGSAA